MDFKFRTIELVEIFLKKTKDPSIFLKHVVPLIESLKDNQKEKVKEPLLNKISNLIRMYITKQATFSLEYSSDLENCITEVLYSARVIKSKKTHKTLKFLLKCLLGLIFKEGMKYQLDLLVERFRSAMNDFILKPSFELDEGYFKDIMSKYKIIGVELMDLLIQAVNLKENGGSKKEFRRNECINLLMSLLSNNDEYLIVLGDKLVDLETSIKSLMKHFMENLDSVKNKKLAVFNKYHQLFRFILATIQKSKNTQANKPKFQSKANSVIITLKQTLIQGLKGLETNELFSNNENTMKKLKSMIDDIKNIDQCIKSYIEMM